MELGRWGGQPLARMRAAQTDAGESSAQNCGFVTVSTRRTTTIAAIDAATAR